MSARFSSADWAVAAAVATLGGAAALIHELVWTRRLLDLLGARADLAVLVLGAFFLGLGLGASWAASRRGRAAPPWRLAIIGEGAVGLLALPALTLPTWSDRLWPALGSEVLLSWTGGVVRVGLAFLVILPPAFAMGVVLPGLTRAVRGRRAVGLYALNILGGLLGLAGALALALPRLGVSGTSLVAIGLNVAAVAIVAGFARGRPCGEEEIGIVAGCLPRKGELALAMFSGAAVLALEVFALRIMGFFAPSALQAAGLVLGTVLIGLFAASTVPARWVPLPWALVLACCATWGVGLVWLGPGNALVFSGDDPTSWPLALRLGGLALSLFGPIFFLAGRIFPSLFDREGGGSPPDWAPLLAINGAGGLLGAIAAQWWLLPGLGPSWGLAFLGWTFLVAALCLSRVGRRRWIGLLGGVAVLPAVACLPVFSEVGAEPPVSGIKEVLEVRHAPEGTIAVIDGPRWGRALRFQRQYTLGGTGGAANLAREAHLPLLLHPDPRDVAFLGLATGITAGASLQHSEVLRAVAFEISPFVAEAAPRWFGDWNQGFGRDPRSRVVVEDARIAVASANGAFDVIIGDLFFPWEAGAGRLFSREHFLATRRALRPGGLFCQWLPLYQLTEEQVGVILATFRSVFPEAEVFRLKWSRETPMLALVGFRDRGLDWDIVRARCRQVRREGAIRDPAVRHAEVVAMLYRGTLRAVPGGINTLENARVELDAGAERLAGHWRGKYLGGSAWVSFQDRLDEWVQPEAARLGELAGFVELGGELERATDAQPMPSRAMSRRLADLLPGDILEDADADWPLWPAPILPQR